MRVPVSDTAILLATTGEVTVASAGDDLALTPGRAVLVTPDAEGAVLRGDGTVFIASTGVAAPDASAA